MSDQLTNEERRGATAKQVLENAVFKDALADLHNRLIENWLLTAPEDIKGREWLHQQAVAQRALVNNLTKVIQTGKMAALELSQKQAEMPKRRR